MTNNTKWILYGAACGFCVLTLTIGSCAVGSLMGAGCSSKQDKSSETTTTTGSTSAPARVDNLPPIVVRRFPALPGLDGRMRYGIIIENHGSKTLHGLQYRTWSTWQGLPYNSWRTLGSLSAGHHFTLQPSWETGYSGGVGLPDGLPIGAEDRVEIRVPGYDEMSSSWN